jgi:hypothetical protein
MRAALLGWGMPDGPDREGDARLAVMVTLNVAPGFVDDRR